MNLLGVIRIYVVRFSIISNTIKQKFAKMTITSSDLIREKNYAIHWGVCLLVFS